MSKIRLVYVTSSEYKIAELEIIKTLPLGAGKTVNEAFDITVRQVPIKETLDIDLEEIVKAEARSAYSQVRVPVFVEHAGVVFADRLDVGYPGGLTKPMWNSLGDAFLEETNSNGRSVRARAALGYCDGSETRSFVGETSGTLADAPRGDRKFYWDVLFVPDEDNPDRLTYAEIVGRGADGLEEKVRMHSQSRKVIMSFLEWRCSRPAPLWSSHP